MGRRPKYLQGQGSAAQVEGAGCVGISDCIQWGGTTSSPAGEWGCSFLLSLVGFLASSSTCEWINAGSEEYLDDEMTGGVGLLLTTKQASPSRPVSREIQWRPACAVRASVRRGATRWGSGSGATEGRGTAAANGDARPRVSARGRRRG
jgi:hypothetical protein